MSLSSVHLPFLSLSYFTMQSLHSNEFSLSSFLFKVTLSFFCMNINSLLILIAFYKILSLFIFFVTKMTLSQRKCRPWKEECPCFNLVWMNSKDGMIYWKEQGICCPKKWVSSTEFLLTNNMNVETFDYLYAS